MANGCYVINFKRRSGSMASVVNWFIRKMASSTGLSATSGTVSIKKHYSTLPAHFKAYILVTLFPWVVLSSIIQIILTYYIRTDKAIEATVIEDMSICWSTPSSGMRDLYMLISFLSKWPIALDNHVFHLVCSV